MTQSFAEALETVRSRSSKAQACTEQQLTELMQAQHVSCLPDMYRQVMLTIGVEFFSAILFGFTTYDTLKDLKQDFADNVNIKRRGFPADVFVFIVDPQTPTYIFFRTRDCDDDPAVYFHQDSKYYYKLVDSLSELVFMCAADANWGELLDATWQVALETELRYDAHTDEFYYTPYVHDRITPMEELIEQIVAEEDDPVVGCTEAEIKEIMALQNVAGLPKPYRQMLSAMGNPGRFEVVGRVRDLAKYRDLIKLKQVFIKDLDFNEEPYPSDVFVFWGSLNGLYSHQFYIFRTKNCDDTMPIYEVSAWFHGEVHYVNFFKRANSLEEFIVHLRDPNHTRQAKQREEQRKQRYKYSVENDRFLPTE